MIAAAVPKNLIICGYLSVSLLRCSRLTRLAAEVNLAKTRHTENDVLQPEEEASYKKMTIGQSAIAS